MKYRKTVLLSYQFRFCAIPLQIIPIGIGFMLLVLRLFTRLGVEHFIV